MAVDDDTRRWLTLLKGSPKFVLKDKPDGGVKVLTLPMIPDSDGFYWVHGKTVTRSGREIESVFRIDTDSGGEQYEVYWLIDGNWYDHRSPDARAALGGPSAIFPFDWEYSIPLAKDTHRAR